VTLVQGFAANFLLPLASSRQSAHKEAAASSPNSRVLSPAPDWIVLKSFLLSLWCVSLCSISLVNFSMAFFMALIVVPLALFFRPTESVVLNTLQQTILFALSPPVLLLLGCHMLEMDPLETFSYFLYGYQILSSWTFPIICFGFYPLSIATMYLVSLPVK
jgi:hypothetical protein